MRRYARWPLVVGLLLGLTCALIHPPLLWYVALGAAVGLAPLAWFIGQRAVSALRRLGGRLRLTSSKLSLLVVVVSFGAVLIMLRQIVLSPNAISPPAAAETIELPATLAMRVDYREDERFYIAETLTIQRSALEDAAGSSLVKRVTRGRPASTNDLAADLATGLEADGWELITDSNLRVRYRHAYDVVVDKHGVVPAVKANVLTVARPTSTFMPGPVAEPGLGIDLPLTDESLLTIEGPTRAVGATYPEPSSEQETRTGHRQILSVPLAEDTTEVEVDVRSKPFRNEILVRAADLTIWSPFGWLLSAFIALASDGFRDLLKRGFGRLSGRSRPAAP